MYNIIYEWVVPEQLIFDHCSYNTMFSRCMHLYSYLYQFVFCYTEIDVMMLISSSSYNTSVRRVLFPPSVLVAAAFAGTTIRRRHLRPVTMLWIHFRWCYRHYRLSRRKEKEQPDEFARICIKNTLFSRCTDVVLNIGHKTVAHDRESKTPPDII